MEVINIHIHIEAMYVQFTAYTMYHFVEVTLLLYHRENVSATMLLKSRFKISIVVY
jgi:hypothetical protein